MLDALVRCLDVKSDVGDELCPITLHRVFASDMPRRWESGDVMIITEEWKKGLSSEYTASHSELQTPSLMPLPGSPPECGPFLAEEPGES